MHLVLSNDFAAVVSAIMAALILLIAAEFQAGVRSNAAVAKTLAEEYKDVIKESVLSSISNTPLPPADEDRVKAGVARWKTLRRRAQRHVLWQWLLACTGAAVVFALGMVVFQTARDAETRGDGSWMAWVALVVTGGAIILVGVAFGLRFYHAYQFARLQYGYQLSDSYGIADVKDALQAQAEWEEQQTGGSRGLRALGSAVATVGPESVRRLMQ